MRAPLIFSNRSVVFQRLLKGVGANSLGKAWALLIQLISVPILTSSWGIESYGVWLMISTIPVYLSLSDFGLGTAAGVDMTTAMAREDRPAALRAFQSVWLFMTALTAVIAICIVAGALYWGYHFESSNETIIAAKRIAYAIIFVTLASFLMIQVSIWKTAFQATHKYALGTVISDLASLLDGLAVISIAALGGDIVFAAIGMLGARIVSTAACYIVLSRLEPWCRPGLSMANGATIRRLTKPSLAALALTLANSLGLQGIVLSIGWTMGPTIAATFATTRMLTRIPLQFSTLLSRASIPELTRAQVEGHDDLTRKLMKANIVLALCSMIPFAIALYFWGPNLLSRLSHGTMATPPLAFALLGIAATLNSLWSTLGAKLLATNQQSAYSSLVLSLYAICAASPFIRNIDLFSILGLIAISEALVLIKIVTLRSKR